MVKQNLINRSQAKNKLKSHLESEDSIYKDQDNRPFDTRTMKKPVLPLFEKGDESRKVSYIFRRIRFIRKRKDDLDQLSYRNVWEVV